MTKKKKVRFDLHWQPAYLGSPEILWEDIYTVLGVFKQKKGYPMSLIQNGGSTNAAK